METSPATIHFSITFLAARYVPFGQGDIFGNTVQEFGKVASIWVMCPFHPVIFPLKLWQDGQHAKTTMDTEVIWKMESPAKTVNQKHKKKPDDQGVFMAALNVDLQTFTV